MSDGPIIEKYTLLGAEELGGELTDEEAGELIMGSWTGAPVDGERDDLIGKVLGSTYRVVRTLGEGAMGKVYEAQHSRIAGKRVAVKVLHAELLRHDEVRERFHQEAEAAALIDHPNAVSVFDVGGTEDGRPYIVSELLSGEDLSDVLQRTGTMPMAALVPILRQITKALSAAHERGVVHRDVKPDNIFLTGDANQPIAKVLDFGISRLEKSGKQLTKMGTVIGTPSYMPPEQGRGQRIDHRADIYGMGAILYRALTGVAPHDKGNPADTLVEVLTQPLTPPRAIQPGIPEPVEQLIMKAMARDADARYGSMREFDEALVPFEAAATTAAGSHTLMMAATHPSPTAAVAPASATTAPTIVTRTPRLPDGGYDGLVGTAAGDSQRWTLLLLVALAAAWLFMGLQGTVTAVVRLARDGAAGTISGGEAVWIVLGVGCTLASALGTAGFHHRRSWQDPSVAARLVQRFRGPVLAGVISYGLLGALLRVAEVSLMGQPLGLAWPAWDILLLALSALTAGVAVLIRSLLLARKPSDRLLMVGVGAGIALVLVVLTVLVRGELSF